VTTAIRRLRSDDTALARSLNALFAKAFGDEESYLSAPLDDDYFEQMLGRDQIIALVAANGEDVIGGLVA